jgi:hypothetical protein
MEFWLILSLCGKSVPRKFMTEYLHYIPRDSAFWVYLGGNPIIAAYRQFWEYSRFEIFEDPLAVPIKRTVRLAPTVSEKIANFINLPMFHTRIYFKSFTYDASLFFIDGHGIITRL